MLSNCKVLLVYSLLLIGISSCKKQSNESPKPITTPQSYTSDTKLSPAELAALQLAGGNTMVSEAEAQAIAFDFLKESNLSSQTNARQETSDIRSLSTKRLVWCNIASRPNIQGRIETDSIPLFVYNFQTNTDSTAGFAIVSGDKRLPQVLVCTIDGSIADTSNATGAQTLLANIPAYVEYEVNRRQEEMEANLASALEKIKKQMPDSIKQRLGTNVPLNANLRMEGYQFWQLQNVVWGNWETLASIGPLIKTKWGQEFPYNAQVPFACPSIDISYRGRAPVGCQATAMAQIMAYWRYPNNYLNIPLYWNEIIGKNEFHISTLFYTIGQLSRMDYGCAGSGTYYNSQIIEAYARMGYKMPGIGALSPFGSDQIYDLATIKTSLAALNPVHVTGYTSNLQSGHAWIIDGYLNRRIPWRGSMVLYDNYVPIYGYFTSGYQYDEYVQCNFGWSSAADGLYVSGIFNTGRAGEFTLGSSNLNVSSPSNPTFVNNLKIIPFIHP